MTPRGMIVAPGDPNDTFHIKINSEAEEALIDLLSRLSVIKLLATLYEHNSINSRLGRKCGAIIIAGTASTDKGR